MKIVIFGCGIIANRIAKSCKLVENLELVGFASKNVDKAKEYANTYDCKEYGDYDYFLNSDLCDAIYVATYNPSHYGLVKDCLKHHKSVICEKPMFSSIKENEELFELAKENGVTLMEAMKAVFLPINIKIKEMLKKSEIGEIQSVSTSFVRASKFDTSHWIYDLKTGGVIKDLGSYCVGTMNYLLDAIPSIVEIKSNRTDTLAETIGEGLLKYDNIDAQFKVSNVLDGESALIISGSKGKIYVENFWKAKEGYVEKDGIKNKIEEELISDFYYELKHFAYLVDNRILESPIMSKEASNNILLVTNWEDQK